MNHFFVDAKRINTESTALTGAEIKVKADVPATYQLFLEEEGDAPDKPISDSESVNLEHKPKHFYAVPPATFGAK
jgi:hypothetical protein